MYEYYKLFIKIFKIILYNIVEVMNMKIEIKNYTYEQMPDFIERAEGSFELVMTGDEIQIE